MVGERGARAHRAHGRRGLGQAAFALAPFAHGERRLAADWSAFVTAGAIADVTGRDGDMTTFVEHRAEPELRLGAGARWQRGRARAGARLHAVIPLAPAAARGPPFVTLAPAVAGRLTRSLWLTAFAELPLHARRQLDWRAGIGVSYRWDGPR